MAAPVFCTLLSEVHMIWFKVGCTWLLAGPALHRIMMIWVRFGRWLPPWYYQDCLRPTE
jgi:hypothetical protein